MDFRDFEALAKKNKTAAAIVKQLGEKPRRPKAGIIDLSHFRGKVRSAKGFSHQDYNEFWSSLGKLGFGQYTPAERPGEHAKFIVSAEILEFAKMVTGKIPTSIKQEKYNRENPLSTTTEGPVFQIATLIMTNLKHMSPKEVEFLKTILENKAQLS